MEQVTFFADSPFRFVPYRTLYERVTIYESKSGVQFVDGVYTTTDPKEIKALRDFIARFEAGKNNPRNKGVSITCPIWEQGKEQLEAVGDTTPKEPTDDEILHELIAKLARL